jgi:hypothetical protein
MEDLHKIAVDADRQYHELHHQVQNETEQLRSDKSCLEDEDDPSLIERVNARIAETQAKLYALLPQREKAEEARDHALQAYKDNLYSRYFWPNFWTPQVPTTIKAHGSNLPSIPVHNLDVCMLRGGVLSYAESVILLSRYAPPGSGFVLVNRDGSPRAETPLFTETELFYKMEKIDAIPMYAVSHDFYNKHKETVKSWSLTWNDGHRCIHVGTWRHWTAADVPDVIFSDLFAVQVVKEESAPIRLY